MVKNSKKKKSSQASSSKKAPKKTFEGKYCVECGSLIRKNAEICPECGVRQPETKKTSSSRSSRNYLVALLLSILIGQLGIDRFYLGYIGLGILKLITFGGCGIWWIIDIILIASGSLRDADGKHLIKT